LREKFESRCFMLSIRCVIGTSKTCNHIRRRQIIHLNPLMRTLKPQKNGPLHRNTVIGTLAVDGWVGTVGCYIWYSVEGPGRAAAMPSPLLNVPNVTAHPSTANVPTLYLSMWHYNCTLKGQRLTKFWLKWETQMDLNLWTASTNARNKVTLSTMIGTLALDGSDVTFSTPNRGLGGWASQPLPSLLYQMKHQASVVYQPLVPTLLASVPTS